MIRTCTALLACTLLLSFSQPATAGEFMDTRLSFVLSENNFFAGPGETLDNSPGLGIGADDSNTLFFDNYDTRFSGFETLSHLALYKKMPSFFDDLSTEAALVLYLPSLSDSGSYIRLIYEMPAPNSNVELILFPVSGDRFRLGYSYRISWGGNSIFPERATVVPAAKLQLNLPWGYAFLGAKTTQIPQPIGETLQFELVTNHGLLAGMGVDIEGLRAELNGGYFTRGAFDFDGVRGRGIYATGLSYQIGYHQGMEIGSSIDFKLYQNDPNREIEFFKPESYDGGLSFVVKHEGTFLWHTLMDPDQFGTTTNQFATAFDVNVALKWGYFRTHFDAMVRSLAFLLHERPGFTPFQDFPPTAEVNPEYFLALGLDYHFPDLHLTPGIKFGVQMPATYTIEDLNLGGMSFPGKRTVVVYNVATQSPLPTGEVARLVWSVKANCKWDISEMLAVIAEVYYSWDDNQVRYLSDTFGLNVVSAEFIDAAILGMNLAAQARF